MPSSIASFVPEPMEKCAVALASPISTMLAATQRSQRMVGKLRQIERLVISRWPCSSCANRPSAKRADAASSSLSRPARAKVCGSVSIIQVEHCAIAPLVVGIDAIARLVRQYATEAVGVARQVAVVHGDASLRPGFLEE